MIQKIKPILFWGPFLITTYMALAPAPPRAVYEAFNDKLLHAMAYTYLAAAFLWAYPHRIRSYSLAAMLLTYGALIEVAQRYIPNRVFSWLDIAANTVGILIALGLVQLYVRIRRRCMVKREEPVMVEQA